MPKLSIPVSWFTVVMLIGIVVTAHWVGENKGYYKAKESIRQSVADFAKEKEKTGEAIDQMSLADVCKLSDGQLLDNGKDCR